MEDREENDSDLLVIDLLDAVGCPESAHPLVVVVGVLGVAPRCHQALLQGVGLGVVFGFLLERGASVESLG